MIFFSNPKVSSSALLSAHYEQTKQRIVSSNSKYILAIQDQMYMDYSSHNAKTELGRIGKHGKQEQHGIIQHNLLCITENNEPLGLMDINFFDNELFDTTKPRYERLLEEKESYFWVKALKNMRQRLGATDKKIITIADRESDFFELFHYFLEHKEDFVIRAKHNRAHGDDGNDKCPDGLFDSLKSMPKCGQMETIIQDVKTRETKEITLTLKAKSFTLGPSNKIKNRAEYGKIKLNAVVAYNDEHQWVLITTLPIETEENLKEIITLYKARWHIEDFHKVLKTGYQVDEIYLHSSKETILNMLAMAAISACRLYWLIFIGRAENSIKANEVFEEFEWKAAYIYFKKSPPKEIPSVADVVALIARMGGFKGKKKKLPGTKTLWIGYQKLTVAAEMLKNINSPILQ